MAKRRQKVEPLTPEQYEAYVAELVRQLDFAKTGTVYLGRRFDGVRQPGTYQIDVALEVQLAEAIKFFLIVECKNWKRPVDRPVVQKLAQTRDALSADKAAIASPVGFTKEAREVARTLEIALWVITLNEWTIVRDTGGLHFDSKAFREDAKRDWTEHPPRTALIDYEDFYWQHHHYYEELIPVEELPQPVGWARIFGGDINADHYGPNLHNRLLIDIARKLEK